MRMIHSGWTQQANRVAKLLSWCERSVTPNILDSISDKIEVLVVAPELCSWGVHTQTFTRKIKNRKKHKKIFFLWYLHSWIIVTCLPALMLKLWLSLGPCKALQSGSWTHFSHHPSSLLQSIREHPRTFNPFCPKNLLKSAGFVLVVPTESVRVKGWSDLCCNNSHLC